MNTQDAVLLTTKEVRGRLKVHRNTLNKLLKDGDFPHAFQILGSWRIPESDVEDFIQKQRVATALKASA